MMRAAAGLALALIVPACQTDWGADWNEVSVHNNGTTTVRVETWDEGDQRTFTVDAGEGRTDSYPWNHRLRIHILKLDGTLLFSDSFTQSDFDDHDRHLHITVNP